MKFLFIVILFFYFNVFASSDFSDAMEISISGLQVQSKKLKIIAENLANESSTGSNAGESPYKRKIAIIKNRKNRKGNNVAFLSEVKDDKSEFQLMYDPSHPAADGRGYVKYPNVDPHVENAQSKEVVRVYESNLNLFESSKSMYNKTLDLLK
jgi:flagellar basal-body rod protein FlgC